MEIAQDDGVPASKAFHPRTSAPDAATWRRWLERNHASAREVWLIFARKHTGKPCVGYDEAVQEALCFGWIDGIKKRVDEDHYTYRFSPRRPGSRWSAINRERAEALLAAGRMAPAGLAAVEESRQRGTWAAARLKRPEGTSDLLHAVLARDPRAQTAWDALTPGRRRLFNLWVNEAVRDETRRRRAAEVLARVLASPGDTATRAHQVTAGALATAGAGPAPPPTRPPPARKLRTPGTRARRP